MGSYWGFGCVQQGDGHYDRAVLSAASECAEPPVIGGTDGGTATDGGTSGSDGGSAGDGGMDGGTSSDGGTTGGTAMDVAPVVWTAAPR